MERYEKLKKIGQGRDAEVNKYFDSERGMNVAIKWIPYDSTEDGLPCSILREISVLKKLHHWNVVRKFGLPDEREWPGVTEAARNLFKELPLPEQTPPVFASDFPHLEPQVYRLLSKMLRMVPNERITAEDALKHPYLVISEPKEYFDQS